MPKLRAFTLIELLIVVAIIAILAAIAVPNFLEAQVRAKVSRCKEDMRSLAVGLEVYKTDTNHYPPDVQHYQWLMPPPPPEWPNNTLFFLTTPVAYITSVPLNPFVMKGMIAGGEYYEYADDDCWRRCVTLEIFGLPLPDNFKGCDTTKLWVLVSVGPDLVDSGGGYLMFGEKFLNTCKSGIWQPADGAVYDPTNGTISNGDVIRVGP